MPETRRESLDTFQKTVIIQTMPHQSARLETLGLPADEVGLLNIVRGVKRGSGHGTLLDVEISKGVIVGVGKTREHIKI